VLPAWPFSDRAQTVMKSRRWWTIVRKTVRVNEQIRTDSVRLVDSSGKQVGIMPTDKAMEVAEQEGLDLVEVASDADPPVCRIMDYGKYRYKQRTRERQAKKHQHVVVLKEIRIRPKIEDHDLAFKVDHIRKFLESGNRVRVTVQFRGRELAHPELGGNLLTRVVDELEGVAKVDQPPKREGRVLFMMLSPLSSRAGKSAKKPETDGQPEE